MMRLLLTLISLLSLKANSTEYFEYTVKPGDTLSQIANTYQVELEELLLDNSSSLSKLKMNHKTAELENPIELRDIRRNIARINTELRAREIQQANK